MHASIYESKENKGEFGIEVSNSSDVLVPWMSLDSVPNQDHTVRDVLLLMGFDVIGKWSLRNKVSRVLVRSVGTEPEEEVTFIE
jgi:hypothetical protein